MKKMIISTALLFSLFITHAQKRQESLRIFWPTEYNWKVLGPFEDSATRSMQLIPAGDSVQHWSIMGFMSRMKNNFMAKGFNQLIKSHTDAALQESPLAKLTIIEKDSSASNFWIIFKVENPSFPNDPIPESQLYYLIQGESTLYMNFVAIKKEKLTDEFVTKWTKIFKSSRLEYKE
jgi:hypothetical protein